MKTPCVKVCVMDLDRGYCKGCYRTLDEIGRWGQMTDAERDAVLSVLGKRKSEIAEASVPPLP